MERKKNIAFHIEPIMWKDWLAVNLLEAKSSD